MNLILFEPAEIALPLPRTDRRAIHLLDVLHRQPGDTFDAGLIDGPRGKGTLVRIDADVLELAFAWTSQPAAPEPIVVILGLPRPQTARDVLRDATTLGVGALHFVRTARSDPNYATSRLWTTDEWRRHVVAGAEQAFDTRLPAVTHDRTLAAALSDIAAGTRRLALDNYEASQPLGRMRALAAPVCVALGPERGWADADRELLRQHAFEFVHLGSRVLRAETALVATLTLVRAQLGLL
ncbi:MAG TPA: RsmE family RNA methyltransferase [Opitutus sp.]|nr:RsmE family RNA methyltransferase [Opitutus sp.]